MTLQQLKYVIAIVEKGSTNEAAKGLYLSQRRSGNLKRRSGLICLCVLTGESW